MRIHLSAVLLLGSIAATAGYVCSWQDGGFTYVDNNEDGDQILTSCCEACPDIETGTGCVDNAYLCDGAIPGVNVECAAAQATTPGQWFTTPEQLYQYIRDSTTCSDVSIFYSSLFYCVLSGRM
jgi:hypothetical protein